MTPEQLAASLIADVPKYTAHHVVSAIGHPDPVWLHEAEVLAALAHAMGPDDLVEQAGKVLAKLQSQIGDDVQDVYLPEALHKLSADTIRTLLARIAAQEAQIKGLKAERDEARAMADDIEQEAHAHIALWGDATRENARLRDRLARMEGAMTDVSEDEDDKYLILKRGMYYRPNAQGYTSNPGEAGRYTLAQAVFHTHPNGPDGPRDGMSFVPLSALAPSPARDVREAALRQAAVKAEDHLMNWANDLAETRDLYREAQSTGKMNGRNISEALARKSARDFNERAEAVAESAEHTRDAILALIGEHP